MGHLFCVRARDPIRFMFNANKMRENQQHFAYSTEAVVMRYFRMRNVLRVCCFLFQMRMNGFVWFPLRHNQHILLIDFCIEFYCANTSKAGRLKYEIDGVLWWKMNPMRLIWKFLP
jgi:hypothetical protein